MFNNLIGKNKELGRFLFCERYTLPPVKNAMHIAEGQDLKRGAVVDVNGVLVGTNSLIPYAVLEFDCDTRSGSKEASVFIKGEFNFDKLTFASGLSKSDMDNIVYNGSGLGIVIKPYTFDKEFSPKSNDGGGYTEKTISFSSGPYDIEVKQKEVITAVISGVWGGTANILLDDDCNDAVICLQRSPNNFGIDLKDVIIKKGAQTLQLLFGVGYVTDVVYNPCSGLTAYYVDDPFDHHAYIIEIKGSLAIVHTI